MASSRRSSIASSRTSREQEKWPPHALSITSLSISTSAVCYTTLNTGTTSLWFHSSSRRRRTGTNPHACSGGNICTSNSCPYGASSHFPFYNTEPCKVETKRANLYIAAEKSSNGRGHNGDRSAQAEQFQTYEKSRTVLAAVMRDQPAALTSSVWARWKEAGSSRRRLLGRFVSNTPGHNSLCRACDCTQALEASLASRAHLWKVNLIR